MFNDTVKILNHSSVDPPAPLVGWVNDPSGRGTLGLISSCLITTAICTWVVIHPRIHEDRRTRFLHKIALWLKTIVAPELIAVEAAQEWMQAKRVVRDCASLKERLYLEQAFYVGMFGVHYRTERGTRILWPNQFIWLIENDLLDPEGWDFDHLDVKTIRDKGKADAFAKLFAMVQVGSFLVKSISRAVADLPLAPLESMTLGYIPLFAITYFYWWTKPKDIETPSFIDLPKMTCDQNAEFEELSIDDGFDNESPHEDKSWLAIWALTPRIFEKEYSDKIFQQIRDQHVRNMPSHEPRVGRRSLAMHLYKELPPDPPQRPKEIVLGHWDPDLYHSKLWPVACLFGVSFPALHLLSWNAEFPTTIESLLWRASALTSILGMLVFMQFERIVVCWKDPLMIVKILSPALYMLTRIIMVALAFAAFRASSPAIYET